LPTATSAASAVALVELTTALVVKNNITYTTTHASDATPNAHPAMGLIIVRVATSVTTYFIVVIYALSVLKNVLNAKVLINVVNVQLGLDLIAITV
jgi:hypothetical protein